MKEGYRDKNDRIVSSICYFFLSCVLSKFQKARRGREQFKEITVENFPGC